MSSTHFNFPDISLSLTKDVVFANVPLIHISLSLCDLTLGTEGTLGQAQVMYNMHNNITTFGINNQWFGFGHILV